MEVWKAILFVTCIEKPHPKVIVGSNPNERAGTIKTAR